ncbi:hypothetical protein LPJ53_000305 [Coemansia erecta]|uniref:Serine/threonine-protein kinase Tel1 n=1 Tax=Coemansia erecta TaxID=147472 RepID=A0A9W7Y8S4_9FUNG|nr:hypothetical protein LPJ53_000305 [Coemansia erecta]
MAERKRRVGVVASTDISDDTSFTTTHKHSKAIAVQLRLIESTKALERARGVQQLAELLDEDRRQKHSTLASSLDQDTWENIVAWTTRILIKESQTYVNKYNEDGSSQASTANERLGVKIQTQYSSHVRHIWVAAMPHLSEKLARFLTKHIVESLAADPCLSDVLGLDYAKVLRAWASHEPHVLACKGSRAEDILDYCIKSLSRFGSGGGGGGTAANTQASTDTLGATAAGQGAIAGDVEFSQVILAIVSSASPLRMSRISERVLAFCADYCTYHIRENPCIGVIIETATVVILATADSLTSDDGIGSRRRLGAILSCCLQLWSTRSAHLKVVLLQCIRMLTRILVLASARDGDAVLRPELELTLKHLTSGSWDKFKFMTLPRILLGTWPLVSHGSDSLLDSTPLQRRMQLISMFGAAIDPAQLAFFDTVSFLVAHLTATHAGTSNGDSAAGHRKKRSRTAPTALARMLKDFGDDDQPGKARGAAQVVWFLATVYFNKLSTTLCSETLQGIVQFIESNDMTQNVELAEWVLGSCLSLIRTRANVTDLSTPSVDFATDSVWQHAVAGVESGLAGTATLVYDIIRHSRMTSPSSPSSPSQPDEIHRLCHQAAKALKRCPARGYEFPDVLRLSLVLSQYVHKDGSRQSPDESIADACSQAILQFCHHAAKLQRPLGLWNTEIRVNQTLRELEVYDDDIRVCERVLKGWTAINQPDEVRSTSTAAPISSLSPTQWLHVAHGLLKSIEQCTENEYGHISRRLVPYISHTLWRISEHTGLTEQQNTLVTGNTSATGTTADQIADEFSERLVAFATESRQPDLLWQTLAFIAPWSRGYTRIAGLDDTVSKLLSAAFASEESPLLGSLSFGSFAIPLAKGATRDSYDGSETQVSVTTETNHRIRQLQLDGKAQPDYHGKLETNMLATVSSLADSPWQPVVQVLKELVLYRSSVASILTSLLTNAVTKLQDGLILISSELIGQCILLCDTQSRPRLLESLKTRVLSLFDTYRYGGHMPTLFYALRIVRLLIHASADHAEVDEDLPRFVEWLADDARRGKVDPFVEIEFTRSVIGPLYLQNDNVLRRALAAISIVPADYLQYRTQTAASFSVRMIAEAQKAVSGLSMPFLQPNGRIEVPDAPDTSTSESLVLVTHDVGLALLILGSRTMVPGALAILILQAEPQSKCPPSIRDLCRRLLYCIAKLTGFDSMDQMVGDCGPDILGIDPSLFDIMSRLTPSAIPRLVPELVVDHVLNGNLADAAAVLAESPISTEGYACRLYAHMLVLSTDNPVLYASTHAQILMPCIPSFSLEKILDESPEQLILHLLMLYRPESGFTESMQQLLSEIPQRNDMMAFSRTFETKCKNPLQSQQQQQQQPVLPPRIPQWGRRYSLTQIYLAVAEILQRSKLTKSVCQLTSPQIAWIALHLQLLIQGAHSDDERQRLMYSLCLLVGICLPDHLDNHLVLSVVSRSVIDSWLCGRERTCYQACLAFSLLLDSISSQTPAALISNYGVGFVSTLTRLQAINPQSSSKCAPAFQSLVRVVSDTDLANAWPYSTPGLLVGRPLESVGCWDSLAPVVTTWSSLCQEEDVERLARVADRAASLLLLLDPADIYLVTCAEFLVAAAERLLYLALPFGVPIDEMSMHTQDVTVDGSVQTDLSSDVVKMLSGVHRKILRYLRSFDDNSSGSGQEMVAMLLRSVSLLRVLGQSSVDIIPTTGAARDKLMKEGDLLWLICDTMTNSHNQNAIIAAIGVVAELNHSDRLVESTVKHLGSRQRQILHSISLMPAVSSPSKTQYPIWIQQQQTQRLDSAFLGAVCAESQTAAKALSELVCALASYPECTKLNLAIPLAFVDSRAASCLLPHIMYEILPAASPESRDEIAAFMLDFVHNWRERAPAMAKDVITRMLQVRQLDHDRYSDIREFFSHLPLALFEIADLAAKLDMPETTAFLLECDLTCTRTERLTGINDITAEARELMRFVYRSLGNQPAVQLLNPVQSVGDVLRRCQDTSDWSTLLLYQEAIPSSMSAASNQSEFDIGSTLVNLGLLNSVRPGLHSQDPRGLSDDSAGALEAQGSAAFGVTLQATYAASWRLAKWDVPVVPISQELSVLSNSAALMNPIARRSEESLYSMFKMRSREQFSEAALMVRDHMSSASAISALVSLSPGGVREAWTYHAISALEPLITGGNACLSSMYQPEMDDRVAFVRTSRLSSYLLTHLCGNLGAESVEPVHMANLTLHEIAVRDAMAAPARSRLLAPVFYRYKEAVRAAWTASRQAKSWQNSMNHIFRLRALSHIIGVDDKTLEPELKLWEAETLWDSGSRNMAIEILQSHKSQMERVLNKAESEYTVPAVPGGWKRSELDAATILLSRAILTVGEWSDKQRKERPRVLWEEYFQKSAVLLQSIKTPTMWTGRALHVLAEFAARQCEELSSRRDDESLNAARKQKSSELAACREEIARATSTVEMNRFKAIMRRLEVQVNSDQKELDDLLTTIDGFLRLATWSYVKCLECTDAFDSSVYSLVSLLVTHLRSAELQSVMSDPLVENVPSHKFLPLVHQLCARLSTDDDPFHQTITRLVLRMTVDYPYHTMYSLFALRNANCTSPAPRAAAASRPGRKSSLGDSLASTQQPESEKMEQRRSEAATQILVGVTTDSPELKGIVQAIDNLINAYLDLAVSPVPEKFKNGSPDGKLIAFGSRLRISNLIKNLPPNVPVLTAVPRVEAPRDYMCVPFVSTVSEGYSLAGGINLPKIVRVLGTDGRRYKQLVKGKDDMRQDAIIQQLFGVINRFVRPASSRAQGSAAAAAAAASPVSGLQIRTYQVVPLAKRCGVLQWVENTTPFGTWFREREAKYRPHSPGTSQLRAMVHAVHTNKACTLQERLEIFNRVTSLAPPIFRFFFYENFYHAQSWFEHREAYIRSAAVASIAGWVLGIGDRHLQNILIDKATAELVHIDLGIAFDLGKLLPIPELVPFRLTREMIDGMGLLGLDGTFRHVCEAALEAMRQNSRVISTILNVLKVDPLYMWSLIPLRIHKMNRNASLYASAMHEGGSGATAAAAAYDDEEEAAAGVAREENKEAGRSILHVSQRLNASISAEGQVSELIQQATDPDLLSRMFEGWSAWY